MTCLNNWYNLEVRSFQHRKGVSLTSKWDHLLCSKMHLEVLNFWAHYIMTDSCTPFTTCSMTVMLATKSLLSFPCTTSDPVGIMVQSSVYISKTAPAS